MRMPFIVYVDFEALLEPIDSRQPDPSESYTRRYQKHTPVSFCIYIKCFDDVVYECEPVMFTAENAIKEIYKQFKFPERMIFTADGKEIQRSNKMPHLRKRVGR